MLLTGMTRDGAAGLNRIKECGGFTVVQDPLSVEGRSMPDGTIDFAFADKVLPLEKIAAFLVDLSVGQRMKA